MKQDNRGCAIAHPLFDDIGKQKTKERDLGYDTYLATSVAGNKIMSNLDTTHVEFTLMTRPLFTISTNTFFAKKILTHFQ